MLEYAILFVVGILVGIVNTFAGNGSSVILPFLMFAGLPAGIANATNRLGILLQSGVSTFSFYTKGVIPRHTFSWYILPSSIGALLGAYLASITPNASMHTVITTVITFIFVGGLTLWYMTKKHLKTNSFTLSPALNFILFFAFGIYGGYIQIGLGLLIIGVLHFILGKELDQVNIIKNVLVFCYTIPVVLFFAYKGLINYPLGLTLAIGQGIGGYLGAKFMLQSQNSKKHIKILFYLMLVYCLIQLYFF